MLLSLTFAIYQRLSSLWPRRWIKRSDSGTPSLHHSNWPTLATTLMLTWSLATTSRWMSKPRRRIWLLKKSRGSTRDQRHAAIPFVPLILTTSLWTPAIPSSRVRSSGFFVSSWLSLPSLFSKIWQGQPRWVSFVAMVLRESRLRCLPFITTILSLPTSSKSANSSLPRDDRC